MRRKFILQFLKGEFFHAFSCFMSIKHSLSPNLVIIQIKLLNDLNTNDHFYSSFPLFYRLHAHTIINDAVQ